MFKYFETRAARKKAEIELAEMRIMLDAIMKIAMGGTAQENAIYIARVGREIRKTLEHRFGWAHETSVNSDEDLRIEEKRIDSFSSSEITRLSLSVTSDVEKSAKGGEAEIAKTIALRLLQGWISCKITARNYVEPEIIRQAIEHEQLHLDHIRNMMRIFRGEQPIV